MADISGEQLATRVADVQSRIAQAAAASGRPVDSVRLVAVTKGVSSEIVDRAVALGVAAIGENRVQEAQAKFQASKSAMSIERHLIGHLQRNKVAQALDLFGLMHSIDSLRLAECIAARVERRGGPPMPVLLQVNVAGEASKSGVSPSELPDLVKRCAALSALHVRGLMTIAPAARDPNGVRPVFRRLRTLAGQLRADGYDICELSMGMSGDFEVAIQEGATLVRIGSAIFGGRTRG